MCIQDGLSPHGSCLSVVRWLAVARGDNRAVPGRSGPLVLCGVSCAAHWPLGGRCLGPTPGQLSPPLAAVLADRCCAGTDDSNILGQEGHKGSASAELRVTGREMQKCGSLWGS